MSAITSVQLPKWNASSGTAAPTATFDSPPPLDSIIIAILAVNTTTGDVDPTIAGFTPIINSNNPSHVRVKAFYKIAGASESPTVTGTLSVANPCAIIILNYQNIDTSSPIDVSAVNMGTGDSIDSGSATTAAIAPERHIVAFVSQGRESPQDAGNSFTRLVTNYKDAGNPDTSYGYQVADKDIPSAQALAAHADANLNNVRDWAGLVFTIKQRTSNTYAKTVLAKIGGSSMGLAKGGVPSKKTTAIASTVMKALRGGKASIIVDPTKRVFGASCAKVTTVGAAANEGVFWTFTPSLTGVYTISAYIQTQGQLRLSYGLASGGVVQTQGPIAPSPNFNRYKLTTSANLVAGTAYRFYIETVGTLATTFWIDGAQIEMNPDATPFVIGSRPSGQGPVGEILRAQKPAALVMDYVVWIGGPGTYITYQEVYANHGAYADLLQTRQSYQDVYTRG